MRTREVIIKVKKFRDYYGFDIPEAPELKTKRDCLRALNGHQRWLKGALTDAMTGVDRFIEELGIEYVDIDEELKQTSKR